MVRFSRRALALGMAGLLSVGCSKPEPPRVLPRSVRVTAITPTELKLAVDLDVYNPNSFPLLVRAASGTLEIGNGIQIGKGQASLSGSVPAKGSSIVATDLGVNWTNLPALAPLALTAAAVPYTFRGTANVGGERLNVEVPFTLTGELTRAQLVQAGLRGLSAIPALQGQPGTPLVPPP